MLDSDLNAGNRKTVGEAMMEIGLTQHGISRYRNRIHPELNIPDAKEKLIEVLGTARRTAGEARGGGLIFDLGDSWGIVKKTKDRGYILVTVYPKLLTGAGVDALLGSLGVEVQELVTASPKTVQEAEPVIQLMVTLEEKAYKQVVPIDLTHRLIVADGLVERLSNKLVRINNQERDAGQHLKRAKAHNELICETNRKYKNAMRVLIHALTPEQRERVRPLLKPWECEFLLDEREAPWPPPFVEVR